MKIIPSLEDVKKYYMDYKAVPLSTEIPVTCTAIEVLKKLKKISSHCYMLESVEDTKETGRYTFLGFDPKAEISCKDYQLSIIDEYGVTHVEDNPREYIKKMLEDHKSPRLDYLPTFTGGLVGYFGYDYIKYSEPRLNLNAKDDGNFKDVDLMLFDRVIAFDNRENKIILIANLLTKDVEQSYKIASRQIEIMKEVIEQGEMLEPERPTLKSEFKPLFNGEEYGAMVERAKHYIREGDIFQVVLSNRLEAEMDGSLFGTYEVLRKLIRRPICSIFPATILKLQAHHRKRLLSLTAKAFTPTPLQAQGPEAKRPQRTASLRRIC